MGSHERDNDITADIRNKSAEILRKSVDILTINEKKVATVLQPQLEIFKRMEFADGPQIGDNLPVDQKVGLHLFFDTINFCFKDPSSGNEYSYKSPDGKIIKRSSGLLAALADSGIDWNNLNEVAGITPDNWREMSQLSPDNTLFLGQDRLKRIVGFAGYLAGRGYETVTDFLEANYYDALLVTAELRDSGYFTDEDFLKRAQLAAGSIDSDLRKDGQVGLTGVEKLTCFADYRIPQVFYNLGVVELSSPLKEKLIRGEIINSGSREELALRATVIVVGEKLAQMLGVSEHDVDWLLWNMSQKMAKDGQLAIPHMIVPTDRY